MTEPAKTNQELHNEVSALKQRIRRLEESEENCKDLEKALEKSEVMLEESDKKYKDLIEKMNSILWTCDTEMNITYVSPSMERVLGFTKEDQKKQTIFEQIVPETWQLLSEMIEDELLHDEQRNPDRHFTIKLDCYHKDGTFRYLETDLTLIRNYSGTPIGINGLSRDITEHIQIEEKLRTSEERHRLIADNALDVISTMNFDGAYTYISPSVERMRGYTPAEAMEQTSQEKLTADSFAMMADYQKRLFANLHAGLPLENFRGELEMLCKDGSKVWTEVSLSPILSSDGKLKEMLGVTRDISARKHYEAELLKARNAAESANRAKSEFLSNISHELRTPLNSIIGIAQLMEYTKLTDEQKIYLDVMRASSDILMSLINDFLDHDKIESGIIGLQQEAFSLRKIIRDVITTQVPLVHNKGIIITADIPEAAPDNLIGDPLRLKQILLNLLSNAVKFTDEGEIRVTITVSKDQDNIALLDIRVNDSGIGMCPEALQRIFKPFVQADGSITRKYGGTGLGLAICTRLVEVMGGRLWAESTEGIGSTFYIQVPFIVNEPVKKHHDGGSYDKSAPLWDGPPLRILLVDDQKSNRFYASQVLQKCGHHVVEAHNGQQALMQWEKGSYDIVLMDLRMPVMDGIVATQTIREKEKEIGGHTMIIAVTAHILRGEEHDILKQGFDGYISKPLKIEILLNELHRCIPNRFSLHQSQDEGQSPPPPKIATVSLDSQVTSDLYDVTQWTRKNGMTSIPTLQKLIAPHSIDNFNDYPGRLHEYLRLLIEDLGASLAAMEVSYDTGDAIGLCKAAHNAKGVARGLRDPELTNIAENIETESQGSSFENVSEKLYRFRSLYDRILKVMDGQNCHLNQ